MLSLDIPVKVKQQSLTFKLKQNYAPFISKSPRFGSKKPSGTEPNEGMISLGNQPVATIKNSSRRHSKHSKEKGKGQCVFKSSTDRFDSLHRTQENPSPGDYELASSSKRMKTLGNNESRIGKIVEENCQTRLCTLPTIPDKRNKYGFNMQSEELVYVEKNNKQLMKEKELMRLYRQSLSEQNAQQHKASSSSAFANGHASQIQLQKKVKAHLQEQRNSHKENDDHKSNIRKSQSQTRIKVHHMYSFNPVNKPRKGLPLYMEANKWEKKSKQTKYQFFDSSEKRFKQMPDYCKVKDSQEIQNKVRVYLHKVNVLEAKLELK